MSDTGFFATYFKAVADSGATYIKLDGNDSVVGVELTMTPELQISERGKEFPCIKLSCGKTDIGFVPPNIYKQLTKMMDAGWICRAFTSVVVFDKRTDTYWNEIALICYTPEHAAAFEKFTLEMASRIAVGKHPAIALSPKEQARVIESGGTWADVKSQKLPKLEKGSAYFKTKRSVAENAAMAAAGGNKGCYIGLIVVIAVAVAATVWFLFLR